MFRVLDSEDAYDKDGKPVDVDTINENMRIIERSYTKMNYLGALPPADASWRGREITVGGALYVCAKIGGVISWFLLVGADELAAGTWDDILVFDDVTDIDAVGV